jgi:hypothetical protein
MFPLGPPWRNRAINFLLLIGDEILASKNLYVVLDTNGVGKFTV